MQAKFAAVLALAAVAVQAAPEKRDSSSGNGCTSRPILYL